MALNLNTEYYVTWQDPQTLDTMKLTFIPGYNYYPSGAMPTKELPTNFIVNKCTVDSQFPDNLPFGRQLANELEIELDLTGLYDRGTDTWTDLIERIVSGRSTGLSNASPGTTIGKVLNTDFYLPNVWRVDNVTDSKIVFLGTQEQRPSHTWTHSNIEPVKIKVLGVESYVYGFLTNTILSDNENLFRSAHQYQVETIYQASYTHTDGKFIQYKWNGYWHNEKYKEGAKIQCKPYFYSVPDTVEYMIEYLAEDVLQAVLRDTTATVGHSGTFLECYDIYSQDETVGNERDSLQAVADLYMIPLIEDLTEEDNHSGIFHDESEGWAGSPNVWDLLIALCEQGICKLTADYNDTDNLTMNFAQPFASTSGTITEFLKDGADLEQPYGYTDIFSVSRTGTYTDEINEIGSTGNKTDNSESYDVEAMFEMTAHPVKFQWDYPRQIIQSQDLPNIRGLYVKYTGISEKTMKIVHDYYKVDLGDSITYELGSALVYSSHLPDVIYDGSKVIASYNNFLASRTLLSYITTGGALHDMLQNDLQGLITASTQNSILSVLDIGKNYTIDTDIIIDGLDTAFNQKVVLTGCKSDYITGFSECKFFVRGENAV